MKFRLFIIMIAVSGWATAQTYSLEQCKKMALENNVQMKNKTLDLEASEKVKKAAFTKYFPQVKANAFGYWFTDPLMEMNVEGGNLPVYDGNLANLATATEFAYFPGMSLSMIEKGWAGAVTATQPLYAGGQIRTGNKLANIGIDVNELQLSSMQKSVELETEKQYWQVISLNEKLKTVNEFVNLLDTLHKNVADAVEVGMVTRNDLLKVELKQNELQMSLSQLTNGISLAKMALCQYIGVTYNDTLTFNDTLAAVTAPEQYYIDHYQALENREEYQMLQKSADAERYKTKMQRGQYLPQAAVGIGTAYLDIMDSNGKGYGMAYGTISVPISGWWEARHKMGERHIKEEQNQNLIKDTNEKLLLQMQQGKFMLEEAYKQVCLSETAIRQAEENLRENRDSYDAGMVNVSDLLEAQAQLQQVKDKYTEAVTGYRTAKMNYLQITGR